MEEVASFLILLFTYFLGSLAVIQLGIRPIRKSMFDPISQKEKLLTNHGQILLLSFLLALAMSTIAYWSFL